MSCKTKVGNDISYCKNYLPQYREKCNYICNINNKTDRLYYNKKYNIFNYCKNYKLEDIFYIIDKNDKFYKTKKASSNRYYLSIKKR